MPHVDNTATSEMSLDPAAASAVEAQPQKRRKGLQDKVYTQLKHGLMIGAFVPGQTITLRKLAQTLGTSPMPVREAIAQLVTANVLEIQPNGSVCVPRLTEARFNEITLVRKSLEGMAASEAVAYSSSKLIKQLDRINKELLNAIKTRDILGCLSKNQEFHFTLYRAYPSEVLIPLIETLWLQAGPIMYFSLSAPDTNWDASVHEEILAALAAKDPVAIRQAVEKDIAGTARYLLQSSIFRAESGPIMQLRLND
ncbi:GntR family transcriptional regulator [Pandoraea terrae]|uniref:GntR family transcriptional regulator n=1 Tax=Pandoraea terrae TaxID=1537710 RepID=A0A5E4WFR1_9BURK|nr:GntR family transcriptional regulator [Pandoraea terrae]VVE22943.1 GntR family transcriptional regulator [Pandoraea terrae]